MLSLARFMTDHNLSLLICPMLQNDLDDPERGMIFVCSATHKTKSMFFFLAQTEQGDIFKVTLETDEEMVSGRIVYAQHSRFFFICKPVWNVVASTY